MVPQKSLHNMKKKSKKLKVHKTGDIRQMGLGFGKNYTQIKRKKLKAVLLLPHNPWFSFDTTSITSE